MRTIKKCTKCGKQNVPGTKYHAFAIICDKCNVTKCKNCEKTLFIPNAYHPREYNYFKDYYCDKKCHREWYGCKSGETFAQANARREFEDHVNRQDRGFSQVIKP